MLRLRSLVFVVEQDCPYLDLDNRDQEARHLLGLLNDEVVACARTFEEKGLIWLGRIVTAPEHRGRGLGRALMTEATSRLGKRGTMAMNAQTHLAPFYGQYGFEAVGKPFLEDGIPHILLKRDQKSPA